MTLDVAQGQKWRRVMRMSAVLGRSGSEVLQKHFKEV